MIILYSDFKYVNVNKWQNKNPECMIRDPSFAYSSILEEENDGKRTRT